MFDGTQESKHIGTSRVHPSSDFFIENFVFRIKKNEDFKLTHKLKTPIKAIAIWLSTDGDDTKSEFQTIIKGIKLK